MGKLPSRVRCSLRNPSSNLSRHICGSVAPRVGRELAVCRREERAPPLLAAVEEDVARTQRQTERLVGQQARGGEDVSDDVVR